MEDRLFFQEKSELFHLLHAALRHESICSAIRPWLFIFAPCLLKLNFWVTNSEVLPFDFELFPFDSIWRDGCGQ